MNIENVPKTNYFKKKKIFCNNSVQTEQNKPISEYIHSTYIKKVKQN